MKKIIVLLALISLFAASCVTQRKCASKFPLQSSHDSIYIETIKKVPVYIKGDSIFVNVPVNCPDQELIKYENAKLKQEISIIKGKLISTVIIKPDTVFVPVTEIKTVVKEVRVPEPVKYKPLIYRIAFWLWIGVIIATAGYFALKIFVFKR